MEKFKILEHIADGKFQAYGNTLEKAFENSAYAMLSLMTKDKIKKKIKKKIKIKGKNIEQLLYNFLEELLYLIDSQNFILSKIKKIKINQEKIELTCEITGDNIKNYEVYGNVKAITYNSMFIKKQKNKFIIQVVVDM
jgi:SHS2 domain-containing protein